MVSVINLKYLALAVHSLKSSFSPTQEICAEREAKVMQLAYPDFGGSLRMPRLGYPDIPNRYTPKIEV